MARVKFTAGRIAEYKCELGKTQSFLWDSDSPGLGLRATPPTRKTDNGADIVPKSYIFQAKLNGQAIRITIGDPQTWTLDAARAEARRLKVIIDNGQDPRQVKSAQLEAEQEARNAKSAASREKLLKEEAERVKRELLARTAWDAYIAHPRPATGKYSWGPQHRADHSIAANPGGESCKIGSKKTKSGPLASLLELPLHAITAQVVQDWLEHECLSRPTFALNAFRKFKAFIRWCTTRPEYREVVQADCCINDDVKKIIPAKKTKEGDCLQRGQLADWFSAVRGISNPIISAYLQALLITGARRGELAMLRWEDVEFNPNWASMTIRDKVEGIRVIPLTPYLSHLISALPRRQSGWVFSSPTSESGHITEPRIAHTKALEVAGLPHVSLHGLRRSFSTLSEWVEAPTGVVAQIQGHKPSAIAEKHYRRRPLDLLSMWHTKIESWMLEQAGVTFFPNAQNLRIVSAA